MGKWGARFVSVRVGHWHRGILPIILHNPHPVIYRVNGKQVILLRYRQLLVGYTATLSRRLLGVLLGRFIIGIKRR